MVELNVDNDSCNEKHMMFTSLRTVVSCYGAFHTPLQNLLRCPIILGVIPSDMPPSCFLGSNLIDQDTAFVYTSLTNKVKYLIKKKRAKYVGLERFGHFFEPTTSS